MGEVLQSVYYGGVLVIKKQPQMVGFYKGIFVGMRGFEPPLPYVWIRRDTIKLCRAIDTELARHQQYYLALNPLKNLLL